MVGKKSLGLWLSDPAHEYHKLIDIPFENDCAHYLGKEVSAYAAELRVYPIKLGDTMQMIILMVQYGINNPR